MTAARILFVDDEPLVLAGFRRVLAAAGVPWQADYARGPHEALVLLGRAAFDIVVADLDMPEIDGVTLLQRVREEQPRAARLVLSGESGPETEALLRATATVHQVVVKPCPATELLATLQRTLELRCLLASAELQRVVAGVTRLPSLPALYGELLAAIADPGVGLADIGDIVARDVSMSARLLHLANSPFFGLPRRLTDPRDAAVVLGVDLLRSLIIYVHLFAAAPADVAPGLSLDALWDHSLATAALAREIVAHEGGGRSRQEEATLAGLLHDLGRLVVAEVPGYLAAARREAEAGARGTAAEYAAHGTSHAEVGGYLLGLWGFADPVVAAVAGHHRPGTLAQTGFTALTAVHVANALLPALTAQADEVDAAWLAGLGLADRLPRWRQLAAGMRRR